MYNLNRLKYVYCNIIINQKKQAMKIRDNIAISDTGFVFDPATGESFTVNETGQEILKMLKEGKNFDEIVTGITARYDIDRGSFERYYQDFVEMLNHYQLIDYER